MKIVDLIYNNVKKFESFLNNQDHSNHYGLMQSRPPKKGLTDWLPFMGIELKEQECLWGLEWYTVRIRKLCSL